MPNFEREFQQMELQVWWVSSLASSSAEPQEGKSGMNCHIIDFKNI